MSSPTSLSPMNCPVNPQDHDNEDNIKLLQVPAWDDKTKNPPTNHDTSLTWSDSLLDGGSDHSYSSTHYQNTTRLEKGNNIIGGQQQQRPRRRRQSKEQLKRKHQIQADRLVEKTFISHLSQSEDDYTQMRTYYENQLLALQNQLIDMRYQRDDALGEIEINDRKRQKNNLNTKVQYQHQQQQQQHHVTRHVKQNHHSATSPNKPITQQIKEIKLHYENQLQRLSSKNQEWERKHTESLHTISTARTHASQVVKKLHSKINQLQTERNQFEQAMKHDNARLRNQLSMANQEIQQLKKTMRDTPAIKQQRNNITHTASTLKKTKNQQYIQHINKVLHKAAADGVILSDTFVLEKVTSTKPITCLQHSPPPSPTVLS